MVRPPGLVPQAKPKEETSNMTNCNVSSSSLYNYLAEYPNLVFDIKPLILFRRRATTLRLIQCPPMSIC